MSGSALCAKFFLPRPYEWDFDFPVGSTMTLVAGTANVYGLLAEGVGASGYSLRCGITSPANRSIFRRVR
ncbi:MAG TPA: hypothetical protein VNZ53_50910, partial [Steroidobacteraceae bacterium]|nr:hypothetical protein [Steroidobacteraceae bacterium]